MVIFIYITTQMPKNFARAGIKNGIWAKLRHLTPYHIACHDN